MKSTWQNPLPEDEIARQQQVKERLTPGCTVEIKGLGKFVYTGVWDTMHCFTPSPGNDSLENPPATAPAPIESESADVGSDTYSYQRSATGSGSYIATGSNSCSPAGSCSHVDLRNPRYLKRALTGQLQLRIPYTILADVIKLQ